MANLCSFKMKVVGERENINAFYNALTQKGSIWMGRGAIAEIDEIDELSAEETNDAASNHHITIAYISGDCKWSIQSALIDNAVSMRTNPDSWYFGKIDKNSLEFVTLYEACKRWNVDAEIYSEELGCCFQEHYLIEDGEVVIDESVDYKSYYWDQDYYPTIEEFNEENETSFKESDFDEDGYVYVGGFESWEFSI